MFKINITTLSKMSLMIQTQVKFTNYSLIILLSMFFLLSLLEMYFQQQHLLANLYKILKLNLGMADDENQQKAIKDQLVKQLQALPAPKKQLSDQQLFSLDFSKLPARQLDLLQKLSFFSLQKSMLTMLRTNHGQAKSKQRFIKDNIGFLTANESTAFSHNKDFYHQRTVVIPAYTITICTASAFIFGVWRLPSRMSTVKYTFGGLLTGVVASYAFWKYSMFQYYETLNRLVRVITAQRYQNENR